MAARIGIPAGGASNYGICSHNQAGSAETSALPLPRLQDVPAGRSARFQDRSRCEESLADLPPQFGVVGAETDEGDQAETEAVDQYSGGDEMNRFTKNQKAEICASYKAGKTIRQLRADYHCGYYTIPNILDEAGVTRRPAGCRGQRFCGEKNGFWKGGIIVKNGRRFILQKGHPHADRKGYVREHRFVMEQRLGRYLAHGEVVHHENGDTLDNRLENLRLFSDQGAHAKYHALKQKR